MMFVVRMAWREARASAPRLVFFFLCVALGVASIVVLRSVMQTIRLTLTREARSFVGADLIVRASAPWTADLRATVDDVLETPAVTARTEVIETQTMAAAREGQGTGLVRLVEVMAVELGFPFYGTIELEGGQAWSHALVADHGVVVQPELLVELGVAVGDELRLAGRAFTIRAAVTKDRLQRSGGFSFGPRVYLDLADLRGTALLGAGSRASYQIAARVDEPAIAGLVRQMRARVGRGAAVRDWRTLEDRLGRNLAIGENYLSLVGFAIVVLGGIGVWSVARVVVQQKIRSVAILKCLGATSGRTLGIYLLQMIWLAGIGSALGVAIAWVAVAAIPERLLAPLGVGPVGVTASAAGQGMIVGLLVSTLFALVPLLDVRRVKPLLLLRAEAAFVAQRRDWRTAAAWALTAGALVLVAIWQAGSIQAGVIVTAALTLVALALAAAGRVLVRLTAPLTRSARFAVRHAALGLARPGNQTRVILLAVGLGGFFILSVRAVQTNLMREFDTQLGGDTPDLILIDIQVDQPDGVAAVVAPFVRTAPRLVPLMRGRIVSVHGRRLTLANAEAIREHRRLTREFGLTHRSTLDANERISEGRFWSGPLASARLDADADTEVSIERELADESLLGIGDLIRFDIAGRPLTARITNIRDVEWDDSQSGGFVFVLRPGPAVELAPQSYVGFLQSVRDGGERGTIQRDLVRAYPNVSVIDVRDVLASVREVVDNVTLGVTIVGAVTLAGGVLILVGAVAMTKFQRLYEAAIYRTLGASTRMLATMVAIEYGTLGMLAGVLGAGGALALSWALARFLFEIEWTPAPALLAGGALLTGVVVCVVGVTASIDVLVRRPLGTLRSE